MRTPGFLLFPKRRIISKQQFLVTGADKNMYLCLDKDENSLCYRFVGAVRWVEECERGALSKTGSDLGAVLKN